MALNTEIGFDNSNLRTFENSMEIGVVRLGRNKGVIPQESKQRQQIVQSKVPGAMEMMMGSMKGKSTVEDPDLQKWLYTERMITVQRVLCACMDLFLIISKHHF